MHRMKFVSAVSLETEPERIVQDIHDQLAADEPFDLVVVFVRPQTDPDGAATLAGLHAQLAPGCFVGCTAGGVVGAGREIEDHAATAVLAARLPGVQVDPLPDLDDEDVNLAPSDLRACIVLVDPFSTATEALLRRLDELRREFPSSAAWPVGRPRPVATAWRRTARSRMLASSGSRSAAMCA